MCVCMCVYVEVLGVCVCVLGVLSVLGVPCSVLLFYAGVFQIWSCAENPYFCEKWYDPTPCSHSLSTVSVSSCCFIVVVQLHLTATSSTLIFTSTGISPYDVSRTPSFLPWASYVAIWLFRGDFHSSLPHPPSLSLTTTDRFNALIQFAMISQAIAAKQVCVYHENNEGGRTYEETHREGVESNYLYFPPSPLPFSPVRSLMASTCTRGAAH